MLIDEWKPTGPEKQRLPLACRWFIEQRHRARRFLFTDEVINSLGGLLQDYPEALLGNMQFAVPPYETCYLEMNIDLFIKAMGAKGLANEGDTTRDYVLGYLLHRDVIMSLIKSADGSGPTVGGVYYTSGRMPGGVTPLAKPGTQRSTWLAHFLGSTIHSARLTTEQADYVLQHYTVIIDHGMHRVSKEVFTKIVQGTTGDIRNVMALLLWLTHPITYNLIPVPPRRALNRGRPITYLAHHIVQLKKSLSARELYRVMRPRESPRRHEVRTFWRNHNKTDCVHDWPIYPDDHGHWHCKKCPQWRHKIEAHERGDAARGFVTKEYRATKG